MAKRLDSIVVATEGITEKFRGLDPIVVHNYPDLRMLPNPSPVPREGKEKVLVYVGGISRLRGAFEMIRAVEYLPHLDDLRLDLIGRFEPGWLEKELQALPGYRRVRFLKWLPWKEAWERAQEATAGLVLLHPAPNYTQSLPVKLFEYMAAGLPVVATNVRGSRDLVEHGKTGLLVDLGDVYGLAEALLRLIRDPELRRRMGETGRAKVQDYALDRVLGEMESIYARYLGCRSRGGGR